MGLESSDREKMPSTPTRTDVEEQGPPPANNTGSPDTGKGLWPRKLKRGSPEHILWQEVQGQDKGDCQPGRPGKEETAAAPRCGHRMAPSEGDRGEKKPALRSKDRLIHDRGR